MANPKQALNSLVDDLDDNEAAQVVDFIEQLKGRLASASLRQRLSSDPNLRPPPLKPQPRQRISPLKLEGEPASETLISERR